MAKPTPPPRRWTVADTRRLLNGETADPAPERTARPADTAASGQLDGLGLTPEQERSLVEGGYGDRAALRQATDAQLNALPGIGRATVHALRKALEEDPNG